MSSKFRVGNWVLDVASRALSNGQTRHQLNTKTLSVLCLFCERPGQTIRRAEFVRHAWEGNGYVGQRGLTNVIWQLRQYLGHGAISTISKAGYRLELSVERLPERASRNVGRSVPLALMMTLIVIMWWQEEGDFEKESYMRHTQTSLTYFNGLEEYPAFSGDGRFLAFTWENAGHGSRIFVRDLGDDDAPLRQISMGADDEVAPAWGPNDQEIAFARMDSEGGCVIMVRSLVTLTERRIDECAHERYHRILDWSRDGRYLFYARSGPEPGVISIYRHHLATGQSERMTWPQAGQEDKQLAVSADGRLAFVRSTGSTGQVFIVDSDDSVRRLTERHEPIYGIAWQDVSHLIVNVLRDGRFTLNRIDVHSGDDRPVYQIEMPFNIAAVPNSNALAFSLHRGTEFVQAFDLIHGKPVAEITSTGRDMYATLSPQGRALFLSTRSGRFEVWSAEADGSSPRQHTQHMGLPGLPVWGPDGRRFAVPLSGDEGRYQIALFDTQAGTHELLTQDRYDYRSVNWYGDENALLVSSNRGGEWDLWKLSLDDGSFARLTDDGGKYGQVFGETLFYVRSGQSGVWKRPLTGGKASRVLDELQRDDWGNWQVTNHGLYYVVRTGEADEVRLLDLESQNATTVAHFESNSIRIYRSLNIESSGRLVLTRTGNRQADIVLLTPDLS